MDTLKPCALSRTEPQANVPARNCHALCPSYLSARTPGPCKCGNGGFFGPNKQHISTNPHTQEGPLAARKHNLPDQPSLQLHPPPRSRLISPPSALSPPSHNPTTVSPLPISRASVPTRSHCRTHEPKCSNNMLPKATKKDVNKTNPCVPQSLGSRWHRGTPTGRSQSRAGTPGFQCTWLSRPLPTQPFPQMEGKTAHQEKDHGGLHRCVREPNHRRLQGLTVNTFCYLFGPHCSFILLQASVQPSDNNLQPNRPFPHPQRSQKGKHVYRPSRITRKRNWVGRGAGLSSFFPGCSHPGSNPRSCPQAGTHRQAHPPAATRGDRRGPRVRLSPASGTPIPSLAVWTPRGSVSHSNQELPPPRGCAASSRAPRMHTTGVPVLGSARGSAAAARPYLFSGTPSMRKTRRDGVGGRGGCRGGPPACPGPSLCSRALARGPRRAPCR